jgi:hypothetical protein
MNIVFSSIWIYLGFDKLCAYWCEIHKLKISPLNEKIQIFDVEQCDYKSFTKCNLEDLMMWQSWDENS